MSTTTNKQALRKLAKVLSGKEWVAFAHKASKTFAVGTLGHKRGEDIVKWTGFDGQTNAEAKAKFIAAANPATILALLDELEAAERRNAELHGVIMSSRKFINEYAAMGDAGAAEFIGLIDRAAATDKGA